jgi:hypothetical protein
MNAHSVFWFGLLLVPWCIISVLLGFKVPSWGFSIGAVVCMVLAGVIEDAIARKPGPPPDKKPPENP